MFNVMLAVSAPATEETIARLQGTHFFDLKIDGIRGILAINNGTVKITNRNGVDVTYRYPDLVHNALAKWGTNARLILDGEIAATDERNLPSFKLTAKRDRQQRANVIAALAVSMPVTFYAFDILYQDGVDFRRLPWSQRSMWLDDAITGSATSQRIVRNIGSPDGARMMELVRQHKLEGLVAKLSTAPYEAGRRSQWIKIKPTESGSFLVTGTTPGSGSRQETFGSLVLAVTRADGTLLPVGEVGSGFKQRDLTEVLEVLATGADLIVEVEYQEFTVDGSLRFPVFKGIRTDLARSDANESQLGASCAKSASSSATSSTSTSTAASTSRATTVAGL